MRPPENYVWVNDYIILPLGFPLTRKALIIRGYKVLEADTSGYRKLDRE